MASVFISAISPGTAERSTSFKLLKNAYSSKYSRWLIGSYLCVWQLAHPTVKPSHTDPNVLVRSMVRLTRSSSGSTPPSLLINVLR